MAAVYVTQDLFFSSRVSSAAVACGLELSIVSNVQELTSRVAGGGVHFVLIDLTVPDLDLLSLVPHLRQIAPQSVLIVAYGPHVDVSGQAGAKQAGCDAVYTRGQFNGQLTRILREYACAT